MNVRRLVNVLPKLFAVGLICAHAETASACAVCFGDPDSAMAKGVVAGVFVLVGVVGFVLAGVAGMSLFWVHRSRRLGGSTRSDAPLD